MSENNHQFITQLNQNDVLFGRGSAARDFNGTRQFHDMCRQCKDEFCSAKKIEPKNILAFYILNSIHGFGGRFLRPVPLDEARRRGFHDLSYQGIVWEELNEKVALAKTKQCIRDMKSRELKLEGSATTVTTITPPVQVQQQEQELQDDYFQDHPQTLAETASMNAGDDLSGNVLQSLCTVSSSDNQSELIHQEQRLQQGTGDRQRGKEHTEQKEYKVQKKRSFVQEKLSPDVPKHGENAEMKLHGPNDTEILSALQQAEDEQDVASQLLAVMTLDEAPHFTEQDESEERSKMTQEDKLAAEKDVYGIDTRLSQEQKRVKRDSVSSLLAAMVYELQYIPVAKKLALIHALAKANTSEFSNNRLNAFLEREDNDPKKAAERFVAYWEERFKLFGPERYTQPLTISGALRNEDLVALRSGAFQVLPHLDASGRHLFLRTADFDTRDGYGRESLLRAFWYLSEVMAESNPGSVTHFLILVYSSHLGTLWDFDPVTKKRSNDLMSRCLPVQVDAMHFICPPLLLYVLKPIAWAVMDARTRARSVLHDCSNCIDSLAKYGLHRDLLPTYMGGTLELDTSEWIAQRQAREDAQANHGAVKHDYEFVG